MHLLLIFCVNGSWPGVLVVGFFFQLALFQFLLALNAIARPRHGFQPLGVDFITAAYTLAKSAFADPLESGFHHRQELPVIIALRKEKLFGIGTGCAVGNVLRRVLVGNAAVFFSPAHHFPQAHLPFFQPFLECFELLLVHVF